MVIYIQTNGYKLKLCEQRIIINMVGLKGSGIKETTCLSVCIMQ